MTTVLIIAGLAIAGITGLALALPCQACRLRRERMRKAYDEWQSRQRGR